MKHLASLLITLSCQFIYAQTPSFENTLNELFQNYNLKEITSERKIKLHKKKEGWFVVEALVVNESDITNQQQFWSKEEQKFKKLTYKAAENITIDSVSHLIEEYFNYASEKDYQAYNYNRNIYFGYPGWDKDIIDDYEKIKITNDTMLESLGRAYSSYAIGFFYDQWGNSIMNSEPNRRKLKESEAIDTIRRNAFIHYSRKCIETYRQLLLKNPGYKTSVGKIDLKYANEYIFSYSSLLFAGYPEQAKQFIVMGIYPDSILNIARTYLTDVSQNGILITTGDNDTYPLWYLQEIENLRQDVIVINYSLLGLKRNLSWLDSKYTKSLFQALPLSFLSSNYDVAYNNPESGCIDPISIETLLDSINSIHPKKLANYDSLRTFPCTEIFQNVNVKESAQLYPELKSEFSFRFTIPTYYLLINDIILFDIFYTNLYKRKLHFTFKEGSYMFEKYIHKKGSVFTVTPASAID